MSRAGGLLIRRSLVRIPAPLGGTELHVEVSLSKILNLKIAPDVQENLIDNWHGTRNHIDESSPKEYFQCP